MDMTKKIILILVFLLIANCTSSKSDSTRRVLNFSKPSKQMNRKAPEQNFELVEKAEKKKKKKKKKKNKVAAANVVQDQTPMIAIKADPKPKEPFIKASKTHEQKKEFVQPEKMFAKDPEQPKDHKKFKLGEFFKIKKFDTKPETPILKTEPPVITPIMNNQEPEIRALKIEPVIKPIVGKQEAKIPALKIERNEQPIIKPIMSSRAIEKKLKPSTEQVVNHLEIDTKTPVSESSSTLKQRFQNFFKFKAKEDSVEITEFNDQNTFPDLRSIPVKPEKYNNLNSINQIYEDEIKVDLEPTNTKFSSSPIEEDIIKEISLPEEGLTALQVEELDEDDDDEDDDDDFDDN